jgi:hypothetical protein
MTEKPLAFLALVKMLEEAVGQRTSCALLDPFPCKTLETGRPAIVTIQNAGRIISQHIGLTDYVFVVSVTAQKPDTAGHIELDHGGREVFVEISPEICQHKDAVLATLSHELSHKFLHLHGIRNGIVHIEQEFLTDVTAVYLGLGKIMLNGCECQSVQEWNEGGGKRTRSHTLQTGYISRECFAFVYRLICEMRGISSETFLSGLSAPAREEVLSCERNYADWFKPELRSSEGIATLLESLDSLLSNCQDKAASHHRAIRRIEGSLGVARAGINDAHRPIAEGKQQIAKLAARGPNPHLAYLSSLEAREFVAKCVDRSDLQIERLALEWRKIEKVIPLLHRNPDESASEVIECPLDGTKLRVPAGRKRLLVTCPSCKYRFLVSTALEVKEPKKVEVKTRLRSLLKSLKAWCRGADSQSEDFK